MSYDEEVSIHYLIE